MNPSLGSSLSQTPATPLLDVLLRVRQDLRERTAGPYQYIGMPRVDWVASFTEGYSACLHALGLEPGSDTLFRSWLRDVKKAAPCQGWDAVYLEEFQGDHFRALLKYLDHVAEFRALPPEALAAIPWPFPGEHPAARRVSWLPTRPPTPTLDFLLDVRREMDGGRGRKGLFAVPTEMMRITGLIDGYRLCLVLVGARDREYARFERWLHDVREIPAGQKWPQFYIHLTHGDARRAIHLLLEDVATFRSIFLPP